MTNQLTLLFLVVVISGALCTVEDYVIMSQCAHNKAIFLAAEGTVSVTDISQTQNITIVGRPDFVNNNFKIALYAKETQRYLCFNDHWKLVGMKELQDTCYFNEAIVHGYFVFRSVVESQRRIGFTQRGRAVGPKKSVNDACYMFTKIPTDQFFHQHNHYTSPSSSLAATTKSTRTPPHHGGRNGGGSGSGAGRLKPNRHRNQHRNEDANEGGSSKSHNKKNKLHNGNRRRQHQQRLRGGNGGGSGNGNGSGSGSGNGSGIAISSDPKNSSYLNSSRQNLELRHYGGGHNHTGRHHNHSQPQQVHNHQMRHHHSSSGGSSSDARRHHHDINKQQRMHHRSRNTSATTESISATTTTIRTTTTAAATTPETSAAAKATTKSKLSPTSNDGYLTPTIVLKTTTAVSLADTSTLSSRDISSSSTVSHKRKGRRRRPHRKHTLHKSESNHNRHGHSHATLSSSSYDDEEYMTTDLTTWINSADISNHAAAVVTVKPTSASLPSWESWFPSPSSALLEDNSDYSASSSSSSSSSKASYEKDEVFGKWSAAAPSAASPITPSLDDKNQNSMPLPLPTLGGGLSSTSFTENEIEDVILPTTQKTTTKPTTFTMATTTLTSSSSSSPSASAALVTLNTSIIHETLREKWLERLHNEEDEKERELISNSSPKEITNSSKEMNKTEIVNTKAIKGLTTNESGVTEVSMNKLHSSQPTAPAEENNRDELPQWAPTKSTEPHELDTKASTSSAVSDASVSASSESGSNIMTDYLYATRIAPANGQTHKSSRHRHNEHGTITNHKHQHNSNNDNNGAGSQWSLHHPKKPLLTISTSQEDDFISSTVSTKTTTFNNKHLLLESSPTPNNHHQDDDDDDALIRDALLTADKNVNHRESLNTVADLEAASEATKPPTSVFISSTIVTAAESGSQRALSPSPSAATTTTRKSLRKSTQRLLATPFHQLTYVRNEAGDIDIDSLDNISIYPDLLDNEHGNHGSDDDDAGHRDRGVGSSRFTMISGYLPTSATATLPESIRIAKIKINRERKRIMRLRNIGSSYSA